MTREEAINHIRYGIIEGNYPLPKELGIEACEMAIKALEQEPCEDCISREAVDTLVDELARAISDERCFISRGRDTATIMQDILDLPYVTPQPKTGRWIFTKTILDKYGCTAECPSCHKKWKTYDEIRWEKENKFCPNCGAKMHEVEENDD